MTAQKGRDLLLKIDTTGAGVFQTVAGLRANALSFNAESVDITHQESAGAWRELLNTDSAHYGGSNLGNGAGLLAETLPWMGQPASVILDLPPLAAVMLALA